MTPAKRTSPQFAAFLTVLTTVFWGTNFPAGKLALASLSPLTVVGERFAIASLGMIPALALSEGLRLQVLRRNWLAFAALGIIGVAGMNGALFVGLQTSNPVTAALIMATTPLSTNMLESLFALRAPSRIRLLGCAISLLGIAIVMTKGAILHGGGLTFAAGDPIIFMGSVGWAAYTVGCRSMVKDSSPMETTAWTMLAGTAALVLAAFLFESPLRALPLSTLQSQALIVYMAIPGTMLAYLFWMIGIDVRGPGATSLLFNLVPIFAVLTTAIFGFFPSWIQLGGMALAITGVLLGNDALARTSALARAKPAGAAE